VLIYGLLLTKPGRDYNFDASKIAGKRRAVSIPVTRGQLDFEREHLMRKLRKRDPAKLDLLRAAKLRPHPMLRTVSGPIEHWEVGAT
jgi:hypothetical protein